MNRSPRFRKLLAELEQACREWWEERRTVIVGHASATCPTCGETVVHVCSVPSRGSAPTRSEEA